MISLSLLPAFICRRISRRKSAASPAGESASVWFWHWRQRSSRERFASRCSITGSSLGTSSSCTCALANGASRQIRASRIEQLRRNEQVRKRGLPPLLEGRRQASLPDLFISFGLFIVNFSFSLAI